jgi:hypothetical protein
MPDRSKMREREYDLIARLSKFAEYGGEMELTDAAYEWGISWYEQERAKMRELGSASIEAGFVVRKQVHLHKLAMVIAVSRGSFPTIEAEHMQEALSQLDALDVDMRNVFGYVGQSKVTQAAREIVEAVKKGGSIEKRKLYQRQFFRTMSIGEFNEAVQSAIHAELIYEQDGVSKPMLIPRT